MKTEVEVEVFGQKHIVVGKSDPLYIRGIAEYVDEAMVKLSGNMRTATAAQLATLVAINLADELFRLRKDSSEEIQAFDAWARLTIQEIDRELDVRRLGAS